MRALLVNKRAENDGRTTDMRRYGDLRIANAAIALLVAVVGLTGSVCAQVRGYTLDRDGERVLCPNPYVLDREITDIQGDYLGGLWNPRDIFIDDDDFIYVADTGNDRVVKMDRDGVLLQEYGTIGPREQRLRRPESVFVYSDGTVLVADTFNKRLVKFSNDGEYLSEVGPPPESLMPRDKYEPIKAVGSDSGYMFVISRDDYNGILMLSDSGSATYFTMNRVRINWQRKWLEIFGSEQAKQQIAREIPMPHTNLYIADDGFIYTVSEFESKNQIKMINAVGENIYEEGFFGDLVHWLAKSHQQIVDRWSRPRFTDLTVNQFGVISAIDETNKRIYQYDRDGNSLAVFGQMDESDSERIFGSLTSIDHDSDGNLYILDSSNHFEPAHSLHGFRTRTQRDCRDAAEKPVGLRYQPGGSSDLLSDNGGAGVGWPADCQHTQAGDRGKGLSTPVGEHHTVSLFRRQQL